MPHLIEGHQRVTGRDDHHQHVSGAHEHAHLYDMLARQKIVVGLDAEVLPTDVGRAGRDQFGRVSLSTVL